MGDVSRRSRCAVRPLRCRLSSAVLQCNLHLLLSGLVSYRNPVESLDCGSRLTGSDRMQSVSPCQRRSCS